MSEEDFKTYIDFGASKIRIGIFDKNFSRLIFFSEKKWLTSFNVKYLNIDESKKNMVLFSFILVFVTFLFKLLGALLYIYAYKSIIRIH